MQRARVFAVVAVMTATPACSGHDPGALPAPSRPVPVESSDAAAAPPAKAAAIAAPGRRLPDGVTPLGYELRLELDPDLDTFTGTVKIKVELATATDHVWLHADELELASASYDDGPLTRLAVTGDRMIGFSFGHVIQPRTLTLAFAFTGHTSHDQEGLFRQQSDKRWYLFSQGESEFARRFVPCFDEPRWKTPWQVTLVVPKGQVGVSNMPVAHETTLGDGRRELAFAASPPIPSYLVAVAVGPFAIVDAGVAGAAKLPVRVIVPAQARGKVGVVAARTQAIVAALEAYTGDGLPVSKIDFVVVPHFFGAMENPGLITFEAEAIVGDPKRIANEFVHIAAHELAHQWFGNLVTPLWWDDLWLSEAFASWLGDRVAAELGFARATDLVRATTRSHALDADDDAGAQPLHRSITFDPENEFDAISYDKGEAVLATFEAWLGAEPFRAALRAYLAAHRGGNVTTADLLHALATATTPAAGAALQAYVDHAGPPVVELGLSCDGEPKLVGHARDHLNIPVCVRYAGARGDSHVCGLVGDRTELALAAATACPAWLYPDDIGYYEVVWTTHAPRGPLPPLGKLSIAAKLVMARDLAAAAGRGDIPIRVALAELTTLAASRDLYGEYAAILIARAVDPLIDDATRPAWQAWLATRFAARITPATAFSPRWGFGIEHRAAELALVTADHLPAATVTRARKLAATAKEPPDPLVVLATGDDRAAFERLVTLAHDTKDPDTRDSAVDALGWFAAPEAEAAVALVATLPAPVAWQAIEPYFERGATRSAAWTALRTRLGELIANLTPVRAGDIVDTMAELCDATSRAEVAKLFGPLVPRIVEGHARLDHALAAIDRCIARRTKAGDIAAALQ